MTDKPPAPPQPGLPDPDPGRAARSHYLDVRKDYIERERVRGEKEEQVALAGAAGALALSVAFLERIAPTPKPETLLCLALAWFFLLLSLGLSLTKYVVSRSAYRRAREELDKTQNVATADLSSLRTYNNAVDLITYFCLLTLLVGCIFLVVFAYANITTAKVSS